MSRDFNTPQREDWNGPIHKILKAVDNHTNLYLKTEDIWHEEQAEYLRKYVDGLKTWIHKARKERKLGVPEFSFCLSSSCQTCFYI
jgi:hypothetical protein